MTVTNLFLYPVKSLGGIAVQEAKMTTRGFQYDRRWMIIDEQGVFISQRSHPLMASIKVSITEEGLQLYTHNDPKGVIVPMAPYEELPVTQVKVWESACSAVGGFMAANIWLSSQLSIECQIVYMPEETNRLINSELVSPIL